MSGAIAKRVNESKSRLAKASYFLATFSVFARWQNTEVRVSVDDEIRGGRMHDVVVANCRYFGAGMKICPEAEPDDGLLDALLIGDITKTDLALTLPKIYRGTHLPHPKAELLRGAVVSVEADVPLPHPAGRRATRDDARPLRRRARSAPPARALLATAERLLRPRASLRSRLPASPPAFERRASSRAHPAAARASVTRFSSGSIARIRVASSSSRSRSAARRRRAPCPSAGRSSFCIASPPASASRATKSFSCPSASSSSPSCTTSSVRPG